MRVERAPNRMKPQAGSSGMPLAMGRRMWLRSVCLLSALACTSRSPTPPLDEGTWCEAHYGTEQRAPVPELSLVIAISNAPVMERHRDAVVGGLRQLADEVLEYGTSVRIAVVAEDPGTIATSVIDLDVPWFFCADDCRTRNYTGTLADALVALAPAAYDGTPAPPLLARIEHALDHADGFLAPGGYLGVLVIGAEDDGSPGDAAGYAERLAARVPRYHAWSGAVTGDATPRIDRFLSQNALFSGRASIDAADLRAAFPFRDLVFAPFPGACLDDVDFNDCIVSDRDHTRIWECVMATPDRPDPSTPLPCFWLKHDAAVCPGGLSPIVERAQRASFHDATITCACKH